MKDYPLHSMLCTVCALRARARADTRYTIGMANMMALGGLRCGPAQADAPERGETSLWCLVRALSVVCGVGGTWGRVPAVFCKGFRRGDSLTTV